MVSFESFCSIIIIMSTLGMVMRAPPDGCSVVPRALYSSFSLARLNADVGVGRCCAKPACLGNAAPHARFRGYSQFLGALMASRA